MWLGAGSIEEVGTTDFKKGQKYHIEVLYSSRRPEETLNNKGQPMLIMAAFRLGGCAQISSDSMNRAAEMAKTSDVVICVTGSDLLWEAEGADRTQWHLPGKTDQLVEALLKVKPDTIICNQSVSPALPT
jgi:beta-glucosidase